MAKEKGYYDNVNLNVNFREYHQGENILDNVLSNKVQYATGRSSLINNRSSGKKVVLLASILQSSPLALVSKKSSGIDSLKDFKNKHFTLTGNEAETSIFPLLLSQKITQNDMKIDFSPNKLDEFINDKTDIITLYTSNQEYTLIKKGIKYNLFHPKDFDFDFYGEILYTSQNEAQKYKKRTSNFTKASLKGWEYAFENIEETIDIILKHYNTQNKTKDELYYEANELKKLAYKKNVNFGEIDKIKIQRIYDIYHIMGLTNSTIDFNQFIFNREENEIELTKEEQEYLNANKHIITVQSEKNWPPYNFTIKGEAKGYSIDYMKLLASKLHVDVNYVKGDSWTDVLSKFQDKKIDVMLNIVQNEQRKKYMKFTTPYIVSTKSILTNNENIYNLNDLKNKTVSVQKDTFTHQYLKTNYPSVKLHVTNTAYQAIIAVINQKVDATVINFAVANYLLQQNSLSIKYIRVPKDPNMRSNLHLAVMKDKTQLHSILQKAIAKVTQEEYNTLQRKWLGKLSIDKKISTVYTSAEKKYLKIHKVIKMCNNPSWEPIEFAEHGDMNSMAGIAIDTINKIEKKLNIRFQTIPTQSWSESQLYLKQKKCDILPAAIKTPKREKYANFTQPYLQLPLAIFTEKDKPLVNGLSDIIDQVWSRQKGSGLIHYMNTEFPNNNLVTTNTINEAFQFVNNGTTDFTIATLPVASNIIQKYQLDNLQIAGYSNVMYKLSIAVRDDDPLLRDILNKALKGISKKEHRDILKSWVSTEKDSFFNSKILKNIFIVFILLSLFLFYRQYLLNKTNSNLKNLVDEKTRELKELNLNLEVRIDEAINENREKDKLLDTQSKMASMGEMIGNIAHQWRQPLSVISTGVTGMQVQKEYGLLDDKQFNKTCEMINENAQYLSKTIDDFKNFIKGDRIKHTFNILNSLNTFIHLVEGSIKENDIKIKLQIDENLEIFGYENELAQCLINIFNNSKDALKEHQLKTKLILISATQIRDTLHLTIQDNAQGIDENIITKVFEPYFTTKHKSQGTGLGLNMTYKLIVDGMKGNITVKNQSFIYEDITYKGAIFTITLPMS